MLPTCTKTAPKESRCRCSSEKHRRTTTMRPCERAFKGWCAWTALSRLTGQFAPCAIRHSIDPGGLDAEAVRTVRQWLFKPALKDGVPVRMRVVVEIPFHFGDTRNQRSSGLMTSGQKIRRQESRGRGRLCGAVREHAILAVHDDRQLAATERHLRRVHSSRCDKGQHQTNHSPRR